MSSNAPIRWFRGVNEVQPSAFHDPAAVDFPPGTVVGIKTRAPVGQLIMFADPHWQQCNRMVECDRDGRVIESEPVSLADYVPPSTVAPVGDPTKINLAEPSNATAAPLVTFEVAPTPPISERDAGIVAKLRERGIPLASIAAAVNEATPEQIVECLLDQQAKRLAADHAAALESAKQMIVREMAAVTLQHVAIGPIKALQEMLADCAVMSQNTEHQVRIGCGSSVVPSELHSAINRFMNAKLTGGDPSADDSDWKMRALAAEKNVNIMGRQNITLTEQLEEVREEAADQRQAHTKEIDELRAVARCDATDTLLDRVRKLAEIGSAEELRKCREQCEAAQRFAKECREAFERENHAAVEATRELAALRGCNARLAKAFDSLTLHKAGDLTVYFGDISAIAQLIEIGVVPVSVGDRDMNIKGPNKC